MYRFLAVRAFECRMMTQMTLWKYISHLLTWYYVLSPSIFWGSRFFSRRLRLGLRAINLGPQKIEGHSRIKSLTSVKRYLSHLIWDNTCKPLVEVQGLAINAILWHCLTKIGRLNKIYWNAHPRQHQVCRVCGTETELRCNTRSERVCELVWSKVARWR